MVITLLGDLSVTSNQHLLSLITASEDSQEGCLKQRRPLQSSQDKLMSTLLACKPV